MKRLITNDLQWALCLLAAGSVAPGAELKVDLNPPERRVDVLTM